MVQHSNQQLIRFQWVPDKEATIGDLETVAAAFRAHGGDAEIEEASNFFGVDDIALVIFGAMGVVNLANMTVDFVKNAQHGGLIVDTATNPPTFQEAPSIDRGLLLVKSAQGEVKLYDTRRDFPSVVLETLARLVRPA